VSVVSKVLLSVGHNCNLMPYYKGPLPFYCWKRWKNPERVFCKRQ